MTGNHNGVPNDEVWVCKGCKLDSKNKTRLYWMVCAGCEEKYESKCAKISLPEYRMLDSHQDILWLCSQCVTDFCPTDGILDKRMRQKVVAGGQDEEAGELADPATAPSNNDLMDQLRAIREKLTCMSGTQKQIKSTLDTVQTDMVEQLPTELKQEMDDKINKAEKNLSASIENLSKTWAQVVNRPPPQRDITIENLKKAIVEVHEGDKEKELRSRGIVVYRAEEQVRQGAGNSEQKEDEDLIKGLLDHLECDIEELVSVDRLGKFSPENIAQGKYRPMKVRFKTQKARDQVLNSLTKLKYAPKVLNVLSIRQDLNFQQRQELNEKVKEARDLGKEKPDRVFRVRGTPGNYRILDLPRRGDFLAKN